MTGVLAAITTDGPHKLALPVESRQQHELREQT
jgi:hypothetical protein